MIFGGAGQLTGSKGVFGICGCLAEQCFSCFPQSHLYLHQSTLSLRATNSLIINLPF